MKHKTRLSNLQKRTRLLYPAAFVFSLAFLLTGCFLKQDRTTVIYGTITDKNQEPVDSILVLLDGVKGFKYETLKQVYSDEAGNYELVVEVPKKYGSVNILIPFGSMTNPKYQKNYKDFTLRKNDVATNNCCFATVGQKTKYDFQLITR
jgi:hypothetical protein